jgi:hypothetical protein
LKKAALFLYLSILSKAPAEIPPFPPFEKGGRRGDFRRPFQKAKFTRFSKFDIVSSFEIRIYQNY